MIRDNTYNSIDYSIKNVHDSLTQIYDCIYRYSYYDEGCYEEDRQTHLVNMKEEAEMLLGHYAILSQEEIEELSNISEAKRFVLIEEALMKYEK